MSNKYETLFAALEKACVTLNNAMGKFEVAVAKAFADAGITLFSKSLQKDLADKWAAENYKAGAIRTRMSRIRRVCEQSGIEVYKDARGGNRRTAKPEAKQTAAKVEFDLFSTLPPLVATWAQENEEVARAIIKDALIAACKKDTSTIKKAA